MSWKLLGRFDFGAENYFALETAAWNSWRDHRGQAEIDGARNPTHLVSATTATRAKIRAEFLHYLSYAKTASLAKNPTGIPGIVF